MHNIDQFIHSWTASTTFPFDELLRLFIAALAGGLIGLEREIRGRQAGLRTNLLVCLGSALVMIVSTQFAYQHWPASTDFRIQVDPARIAYGVMMGVGFLGAGTIIHDRGTIHGLTTAAGLWCVAAVGLAAGLGLYILALLATAFILIALWGLTKFEIILPHARRRTLVLRRPWEPGCVDQTVLLFKNARLIVTEVSFLRHTPDLSLVDISLEVAFSNPNHYYAFERQLDQNPFLQILSAQRREI